MELNNNLTSSETPTIETTTPKSSSASIRPTEPFAQTTTQPNSNPTKSSKPTIWCLAILAAIGIITAAVFAYLYFTVPTASTPTSSDTDNSQSTTIPDNTGKPSSQDDSATTAPLTVDEISALLKDKYNFPSIEAPMFDGWYNYIENLDQPAKILFTIYQVKDQFGPQRITADHAIERDISFDDFYKAYTYYFGNEEPLEKKTYELNSKAFLSEIIYNSENDNFTVAFPDGLGGTTPARMIYKVISGIGTENGFKAIIASTIIEPDTNGYPSSDTALEKLSVYELNFTKENDEYVLSYIEKL